MSFIQNSIKAYLDVVEAQQKKNNEQKKQSVEALEKQIEKLEAELKKAKEDADVKVGDFVSSSPASTLLPPNIPIGIVQSIDDSVNTKKTAKILLLAKPQLIDWVQISKVKI